LGNESGLLQFVQPLGYRAGIEHDCNHDGNDMKPITIWQIFRKGLLIGLLLDILIAVLSPLSLGIGMTINAGIKGISLFLETPILNIGYGGLAFIFFLTPCMMGGIALAYLIKMGTEQKRWVWFLIGFFVYISGTLIQVVITKDRLF
jgi:hypothetical protein